MPLLIRNIIRFIILMLLQMVVLNNMTTMGFSYAYLVPQVYVLFILFLPFETPTWLSVMIGFVTGLIIDFSLNTEGLHAFACTTLAYAKPSLTRALSPRDDYDFNSEPTFVDQGMAWFLTYSSILIFIHHFVLFFMEKLSWSNFLATLFTVVLSSVFTLIIAIIYQFIVYPKKRT
ncbi:MAG: rod shape-determining protein MreD [Flavobacteriales bacterium]